MLLNHLPPLYFLHIPKTAGTSFRQWLSELFAESSILPISHLAELETTSDAALRATRFASGHFGWQFMERSEAAGLHFEVITVLRNPVDMQMSGLSYVGQITDEDLRNLSSDQFVASREIVESGRRGKFANFADAPGIPPEGLPPMPPHLVPYLNMCVRFIAINGTEDPNEPDVSDVHMELAKKRLSVMPFFALAEDWDWSAVLFADHFGLPFRRMDKKINASPNRRAAGPGAIERLRYRHKLDCDFYDFARRVFVERVFEIKQRYGFSTDAEPSDFAAPLLARFLKTSRGVPKVSKRRVRLSEGIVSEGFGPRNYYEPYKGWLRWAGPAKTCSIYLPLDRSATLALRFEIPIVMSDRIRDELEIAIAGRSVEVYRRFKRMRSGDWYLVMTAVLPADDANTEDQYTEIRFNSPETVETDVEGLPPRVAFALGNIVVARKKQWGWGGANVR
jgi:hypothetical protein